MFLLLVTAVFITGKSSFALKHNYNPLNFSVTAEYIRPITIGVPDFNFDDFILDRNNPNPKPGPVTNNVSFSGNPGSSIQMSVPKSVTLNKTGGGATVTVTMNFQSGTVSGSNNVKTITLSSTGYGTSDLIATLDAAPTTAGVYSGTVTVTATYN